MSRNRVKLSLLTAGISEYTCSPTSKELISYWRRWIWLLIKTVNLTNVMVVSQICWNVLHYLARRKIQSWDSNILSKTEWRGQRSLDAVAVTVNICSRLPVFFQMLYWMKDFSHNQMIFLGLSSVFPFSCQICANEWRTTSEKNQDFPFNSLMPAWLTKCVQACDSASTETISSEPWTLGFLTRVTRALPLNSSQKCLIPVVLFGKLLHLSCERMSVWGICFDATCNIFVLLKPTLKIFQLWKCWTLQGLGHPWNSNRKLCQLPNLCTVKFSPDLWELFSCFDFNKS